MKPPQNSATADIEFVRERDPAWDLEKINEELGAMDEDSGTDHPWVQYVSGKTRYDLDAPGMVPGEGGELVEATPRSRFKAGAEPRIFGLRRMRIGQVSKCYDIGGRTGYQMASQYSLKSIAPPITGLKFKPRDRPMSEDEMQQVADAIGMEAVWEVGQAALEASKAPTEAEKKPSGS